MIRDSPTDEKQYLRLLRWRLVIHKHSQRLRTTDLHPNRNNKIESRIVH